MWRQISSSIPEVPRLLTWHWVGEYIGLSDVVGRSDAALKWLPAKCTLYCRAPNGFHLYGNFLAYYRTPSTVWIHALLRRIDSDARRPYVTQCPSLRPFVCPLIWLGKLIPEILRSAFCQYSTVISIKRLIFPTISKHFHNIDRRKITTVLLLLLYIRYYSISTSTVRCANAVHLWNRCCCNSARMRSLCITET